ncbi:hypothetical protein Q0590_26215 [Rhodocytophaga aerolata]|uniref:Oligosaccharide repeat unit polymerase n=1 Tax=Rhodocytophaga aerolata TaxID=455078 RepID=A0ABT8RDL4_9BACT|nr:hypothetical protein [Rhodocytophaga aerolata]MDO1449801.1 hypothetical protein [Rhodocytophaga aerolata]
MSAQHTLQSSRVNYLLLYIPWFIALLLEVHPIISYTIAWLGSFMIFYISMSGKVQPLPNDLPIIGQLMRPVFITQLVFIGYLAITSVFFFLELNGYYYFEKQPHSDIDKSKIALASLCQRYYCLAHASFTYGILLGMKYNLKPKWTIKSFSYSSLMLKLSAGFTTLAFISHLIPGFVQFAIKLEELSFVSAVLSLALAIPEGKKISTLISSGIFAVNMVNAFLSGWKEQIIVPLIMLGVYLYPYYKQTVTLTLPVLLALFFIFIPTYNNIFRGIARSGETDSEMAAKIAIEAIRSGEEDLGSNNWKFLTGRLSEIGMFVDYVERVPRDVDFYGLLIIKQSIESMIPRALWSGKPITEELVMQRVWDIGIVDRNSIVSAKPPLITDGYLSGGAIGIVLLAVLLGYTASKISVLCENLFGGYLIGTGLMYTGLFQIFWRGNCFEFMLNSVFWSYVLLHFLFFAGRYFGLITRNI